MSASRSKTMPKALPQPCNFPPPQVASSTVSPRFAMIELKQRILGSLSKLGDRDTYQIAVDDLEIIIAALSRDEVPMVVNCLCEASVDPKSTVKKESIRLLSVLCRHQNDALPVHLSKIISHIIKRLRDSDSSVRDSCCDAIGSLSSQFLKGHSIEGENPSRVSLFLKPLLDSMKEQNKVVQAGSAQCIAKLIDCAAYPPMLSLHKLCPKICKFLNNPNFLAKAALLPVIASLSKAGAIVPQNMEQVMKNVHNCLGNPDWATRKAAADVLAVLAVHSEELILDSAVSTLQVLDGSRFDKVKPVRDSAAAAMQLWKNVSGNKGGVSEADRSSGKEEVTCLTPDGIHVNGNDKSHSLNSKDSSILERTVGILKKKKASGLTERELNPGFFKKLETTANALGDLPVEVIVPRKHPDTSNKNKIEDDGSATRDIKQLDIGSSRHQSNDDDDDGDDDEHFCSNGRRTGDGGNWVAIRKHLFRLERQQAHLLNVLQDFMDGSHESMATLENRVCGLERVVEDIVKGLSMNSRNYGTGFRREGYHSVGLGRSRKSWGGGSVLPSAATEDEDARSVRNAWQASRDTGVSAMLQAIRGIKEESKLPESDVEILDDDDSHRDDDDDDDDRLRACWSSAVEALRGLEVDSAYVEVLSTGSDYLLAKLMRVSGPVLDHLSNETKIEVLQAIAHFLPDHSLSEMSLSWLQQLAEMIVEDGHDVYIPVETKREVLMNLGEIELDDAEERPVGLLIQLAAAWGVEVQKY